MNFHKKSTDSPRTTLQASLQCDVIGLNAAISACEKAPDLWRDLPWDLFIIQKRIARWPTGMKFYMVINHYLMVIFHGLTMG